MDEKIENLMPKGAEKLLTEKGKVKLFEALEEYIEAMIENRVYPMKTEEKDTWERCEKAENELKEMIMAMDWRLK